MLGGSGWLLGLGLGGYTVIYDSVSRHSSAHAKRPQEQARTSPRLGSPRPPPPAPGPRGGPRAGRTRGNRVENRVPPRREPKYQAEWIRIASNNRSTVTAATRGELSSARRVELERSVTPATGIHNDDVCASYHRTPALDAVGILHTAYRAALRLFPEAPLAKTRLNKPITNLDHA